MDHYSHNSHTWWPQDDLAAYEDLEQSAGRNSTSTFDTVYSGGSNDQTPRSTDLSRFSRAPSLASSRTSYSSSSQPSTYSWLSTSSICPPVVQDQLSGQLLWRQTLKEKQATNLYACSHCSLTFSKKADRKQHILRACPYFGSEFLCAQCPHISRNKHQAKKHQKDFGHEGTCEAITFSKHALTCSNDGKLYRNLEEYLDHFSSSSTKCILNSFDGNRKHLSRLRTLLSEGRDDDNGHSYIYAALIRYCSKKGLDMEQCNAIIDALPSATAKDFAERLEWGYASKESSARSRLGYTNFDSIVGDIMTAGVHEARRQRCRQVDSGCQTSHLTRTVPSTQELLQRHISSSSSSSDSFSIATTNSSVCIRRKQIPISPISTSRPLPPLPPLSENHEAISDEATQLFQDSSAVTAATAMLRQQCLFSRRPGTHSTQLQDSGEKRPRPASSPGQQESPPHTRMDLRPSPTRKGDHAHASLHLYSSEAADAQDDTQGLADWPEFYSLTPPLTARNTPSAADSDIQQQTAPDHVKQKRQARMWKALFDEFITLGDEEDDEHE